MKDSKPNKPKASMKNTANTPPPTAPHRLKSNDDYEPSMTFEQLIMLRFMKVV